MIGLLVAAPVIVLAILLVRLCTGESGLFWQKRVGHKGKQFWIVKIRTMRERQDDANDITVRGDSRVTGIGGWLRRTKIDELPQLWNVLKGEMSLVGPRPDVPRQVELLKNGAVIVLSVRPGITGPASIRYRQEEELLSLVSDPYEFNDRFIFPDKTIINIAYVREYSLLRDFRYIVETLLSKGPSAEDLLLYLRGGKPLVPDSVVSREPYRASHKKEPVV